MKKLLSLTFVLPTLLLSSDLQFESIPASKTDIQKHHISTTTALTYKGKKYPLSYHTIARSGDKFTHGTFGEVFDKDGKSLFISNANDYSSLHVIDGEYFMLTQFESVPAALYITTLQRTTDGNFKAIDTKNVDFSHLGGYWAPCAGSVTPWKTHLSSEEYEPDASLHYTSRAMRDYFGGDDTQVNFYNYGWIPEVSILNKDGDTKVVKHYAMGRFSHELAFVMPDQKTVYMSDDGYNVGFFMFIADKAADLSSGTLYAAKWIQESKGAKIEWITLGHSSDKEIQKALKTDITFSQLFEKKEPFLIFCPPSFHSINTSTGHECLRLKPGMDELASRLETRRYAALQGATTEFNKLEGITYDNNKNRLYLSVSYIDNGMTDAPFSDDLGGNNDIQLKKNKCGAVYQMDLAYNPNIDSNYTAIDMKPLLSGTPHKTEHNTCDINNIANPDNITYINNQETLIIGEDSGSGHQNDMIWAYDLKEKRLSRILNTPYGSETTALYYYHDLDGYDYIMGTIQHPYTESDQDKATSEDDKRAYTGYFGPMPVLK